LKKSDRAFVSACGGQGRYCYDGNEKWLAQAVASDCDQSQTDGWRAANTFIAWRNRTSRCPRMIADQAHAESVFLPVWQQTHVQLANTFQRF
jgi:hypothetical protein